MRVIPDGLRRSLRAGRTRRGSAERRTCTGCGAHRRATRGLVGRAGRVPNVEDLLSEVWADAVRWGDDESEGHTNQVDVRQAERRVGTQDGSSIDHPVENLDERDPPSVSGRHAHSTPHSTKWYGGSGPTISMRTASGAHTDSSRATTSLTVPRGIKHASRPPPSRVGGSAAVGKPHSSQARDTSYAAPSMRSCAVSSACLDSR